MFAVQRDRRFQDDAVDHELGPGTYDCSKYGAIRKSKPAAGGFGLSERESFSVSEEEGGPGCYDVPARWVKDAKIQSAAFRSGTDRVEKKIFSSEPGPGAYLSIGSAEKKKVFHQPAENPVRWERVPTAPSIPAAKQSFGYEEGKNGELILQRPKELYDGSAKNHVGPADYRPEIPKNVGVVNFGKSNGKRLFDGVGARKSPAEIEMERYRGLPPGARYVNEPQAGYRSSSDTGTVVASPTFDGGCPTNDGKPRMSASFASNVHRSSSSEKSGDDIPGPGNYDIAASFHYEKTKGTSFAGGGPRFSGLLETTTVENASGATEPDEGLECKLISHHTGQSSMGLAGGDGLREPSEIEQRARQRARGMGPFHDKKKVYPAHLRLVAQKDDDFDDETTMVPILQVCQPDVVAFASTATRFRNGSKNDEGPGPGSYDARGFAEKVKKRRQRGGGFGTSTRRFPTNPAPHFEELALKEKEPPKPTRKKKTTPVSSVFASKTSRVIEKKDFAPPPGAYDVPRERLGRGIDFSKSKSRSVLPSTTSDALGPGAYNLGSTLRKQRPPRKPILVSAAPRFVDCPETETKSPGPGTYDYQLPSGNLLKPTYNIAIAAECRELKL